MANRGIRIPAETLLALRTRLAGLPPRSAARREEVGRIAGLFGVSPSTVYRALKSLHQPKGLRRSDRGKPRGIQERDLARYWRVPQSVGQLLIFGGDGRGKSWVRVVNSQLKVRPLKIAVADCPTLCGTLLPVRLTCPGNKQNFVNV